MTTIEHKQNIVAQLLATQNGLLNSDTASISLMVKKANEIAECILYNVWPTDAEKFYRPDWVAEREELLRLKTDVKKLQKECNEARTTNKGI